MGRLTTHVLDTANGRPAARVRVALRALGPSGEGRLIAEATTNADGRTDAPLLEGGRLTAGDYELVFHVGGFFREGFYEHIPVRFRIADPAQHYHVPLLCSPWGYSTYRGS